MFLIEIKSSVGAMLRLGTLNLERFDISPLIKKNAQYFQNYMNIPLSNDLYIVIFKYSMKTN